MWSLLIHFYEYYTCCGICFRHIQMTTEINTIGSVVFQGMTKPVCCQYGSHPVMEVFIVLVLHKGVWCISCRLVVVITCGMLHAHI